MNVGAIVWSEKSILLVHQESGTGSETVWTLPGGGVDPGETVLEAAAREVLEETGVIVEAVGRLVYVMEYMLSRDKAPGGLSLVFEVTKWNGVPQISEDGIIEARFVPVKEAIGLLEHHLIIPRMRDPVLAFLRGEVGYGAFWVYGRTASGSEHVITCTEPPSK